ncbi:hypothetical protein HOG17_00225 [Candidatus Peregrinibacteria bacterium]|jgi:hypothetical protein|nr:hypothetical protein [Candidatus Peregrinibacteria bacterium]MBT4147686.1 hypothetical protein [Candidatus Peregrinibacteria bacterium]MBT4365965.1 hypothetical protein [Candidatus Peregrinibacteria bacterium]MBT4455814.1 hypothetical protein [Candidatus Peregrinibacteria bacterium]
MKKTLIFALASVTILLAGCSPQEPADEPNDQPVADMKIYTSVEYGFSLQYPSKYKTVVDDYGWPNSVVHFIEVEPGAQSYRATISVWTDEAEYTASSVYSAMEYAGYEVGDNYVVIGYFADSDNADLNNEWQEVINSFDAGQ